MPTIKRAAPQFLVTNLRDAIAFYEERLGFTTDFVYEDFYASVSRDGAPIHLKCAPRLDAERAHRRSGEHLDAFLDVSEVRALHDELVGRGAPITQPLGERPWGTLDFQVEDPDGYILCFSEATAGAAHSRASTPIGPPVAELPVADVEQAQHYYRDVLGFEVGWLYPGKEIGAVSRKDAVIFFRRRQGPFEPAVHWVFAGDIHATYEELRSSGARIVEPLEKKPWGLTQFTLEDLAGHRFHFHRD